MRLISLNCLSCITLRSVCSRPADSGKDAGLIPSLTQMKSEPTIQRGPVDLWEHITLFDPLLLDHHSPIRWTFRPYYFYHRRIRRVNLSQQRCHLMLVCEAWYNDSYGILHIYFQATEAENGSLPPYPIHTIDHLYSDTNSNIEGLSRPTFQFVQSLTSEVASAAVPPDGGPVTYIQRITAHIPVDLRGIPLQSVCHSTTLSAARRTLNIIRWGNTPIPGGPLRDI